MTSSANINGNNLLGSVAQSTAQLGQVNNAGNNLKNADTTAEQKEVSEKFEAVMLGQMMKYMFDTVPVDDNFGGGSAEETFRGMLVDEYGNIAAKSGGIGIAKDIQRSMIEHQGGNSGTVDTTNGLKAYDKVNLNNK